MDKLLGIPSTKLGLGATLVIVGATALISYSSISRVVDGAHFVDHTYRLVMRLEQFTSQLEHPELRQRGYLISGDERHLARRRAATKAPREMTADNPRQQEFLMALEPLVSSRLALLQRWVELKRPWKVDVVATLSHLVQGGTLIGQIHTMVTQTKAEEDRVLDERSGALKREKVNTNFIIMVGNAVAFVFLLLAFFALTREIGKRKKAAADARRYASEIEDLYNNAPCGHHSLDQDGVFVRINDTELNWLGYTREGVVGKMTMSDILTTTGRETFQQSFLRLKERGWLRDMEFDLVRENGTILPVLLSALVVRDESGEYQSGRFTLFDITDRRQAEHALRQANAFLDSVFEHIPDMIFVKDAKDLRFVRFNKAGADLIGCTTEDLIGKCDYDFFPPDEAEFFMTKDRETLAGGVLVDIPEEPLKTREQGVRILHTKKIPLPIDGTPRYLLGISEDITERKKAELQIQELNDRLALRASELEITNKELESFSYSVSHDLRTPLRAIEGYSRMLEHSEGDRLEHESRRFLGVIRENARMMGQLIDDLLAFSKLGRQALSVVEVDMTSLAKEAFGALLGPANQAAPRLVLGTLPTAQGDRALLRQVWVNLLSNAAKYSSTRSSPLIEITGRSDIAEHTYCVKDNGVGFDMKYYDKLFGVFHRLHNPTEFPGTGVGLAIVQRVIARHGGRVWAEGKIDEGAEFYFSLPRRPSHD